MQGRPGTNGYVEVSDYGSVLRRRWYLVILGVLAGAAVAAGYLLTSTVTYASTTSVLVTPTDVATTAQVAGGRTTGPVDLDTEAQLVKSSVVAQGARTLLRSRADLRTLIDRVGVAVPPNTAVLDITYTAASPRAAQHGSHAFAQAYLDNRAAKAKLNIQAQMDSLQSQIDALSSQLQDVTGKIADLPPNSPDRTLAIAQQSILISQLSTLNDKLAPLRSAQVTPGDIISDASAPTSTRAPAVVVWLSGALGGLLLGLGAAAAAERLSRRIRTPAEVARLSGEPVLAELPRSERQPIGEWNLAYDRLANRVVTSLGGVSVVVVAGASSTAAGAAVASGLADALVRRGERVALVDARLPGADGADANPLQLTSAQLSGGEATLRVGELTSAATELARDGYRYVVVAAPAMNHAADGQRLAGAAEGMLVVVERGHTSRTDLTDALAQLENVQVALLGTVVMPRRRATADRQGGDRPGAARGLLARDVLEEVDEETDGRRERQRVGTADAISRGTGSPARMIDEASGGAATGG